MIAIKTLNVDGMSQYQRRRWPLPTQEPDGSWTPGEWVVSRHASATPLTVAGVDDCTPAVYGCLPDQVHAWVDARAWIIELDGAVVGGSKVGAVRGQLLRPVKGWTDETLKAWGYWCADRAIRIHAVAAIRSAGLVELADRLAALPEIVDNNSARAAEVAARAAEVAARATAEVAGYVAYQHRKDVRMIEAVVFLLVVALLASLLMIAQHTHPMSPATFPPAPARVDAPPHG